jgi:hypothetical protein
MTDTPTFKKRASRLWRRDDIPQEFRWMEQLSALHFRPCLVELHTAIKDAHVTGVWGPAERLAETWEATALVDASADAAAEPAKE